MGVSRSHEAVRRWVHRLAEIARRLVPSEQARVAVVDETAVNVGGRITWLWLAIEPERRAVLVVMLTHTRNVLVAYRLLKDLRHRVRDHASDAAAPRYALAAGWARLHHSAAREDIRNYVKRFAEAVKDRLRGFDCYFPSRLLGSALRLAYAWASFYNYVRVHMGLGEPPPAGCLRARKA